MGLVNSALSSQSILPMGPKPKLVESAPIETLQTPDKPIQSKESFDAARLTQVGKGDQVVNASQTNQQIKQGIEQADNGHLLEHGQTLLQSSVISEEFGLTIPKSPPLPPPPKPSPFKPSSGSSAITADMLVAAKQKLKQVSQHQVLNLGDLSTGSTAKESTVSRKLGSEVGGVPLDRDRLPSADGTIDIVGHSSDGGMTIEGRNPQQLAQLLKDQYGLQQIQTINLVSCKSEAFKAEFKQALADLGVEVGTVEAAKGNVAVDRATGKTLDAAVVGDLDKISGHDGSLGDIKKLGGKGAGLQDLQEFCASLNDERVCVPKFFVVETGVYNKFVATNIDSSALTLVRNQMFPEHEVVEGLTRANLSDDVLAVLKNKSIAEMGQAIAGMEEPQRTHCAKFLVKLINSPHMFNAIKDTPEGLAIKQDYTQKFGTKTVAVRSSGTMEDGSKDSAAGLYKSLLGNKGEDAVLKAVLETISSNFEPKVFVHRQTYGQEISQSRMACVIQEVFEPQFAGVGFSLNPVNPHEITINFAEGLGEFVVGSHGQPAKVTLNRLTKEVTFENGSAKYKFSLNHDKDRVDKVPFTKETEPNVFVPETRVINAKALGDMANKLADIIDKMETHFKRPVDMEFGINVATGELALLQQRTVTVTGTTSFSDIGDLKPQVHMESGSIFEGGVAKGALKHIANPKTFDFSTLHPSDIIVVTNFTDEIEANINKFSGYISLNGGDLDHGAIVLRQHHKVAMRVSQEQFASLLENDLGKEVTLGVGKFSGVSSGKIFLGDKKDALEAKATRETELKNWDSTIATLAQDLEAIQYPKNLNTAQDMGSTLKSMVSLNARLLQCFHPEQGGTLGKFLDTDPFFFTTQDPEIQLANSGTVQNELGMFFTGMKTFVEGYVAEVTKLNPTSPDVVAQEKKLLTQLDSIHKEIGDAFTVLNDPDKSFRERAGAMQAIKDKLLKLDHTQGEIMNGNPDGLVSTHELIIRVHRNMFVELKNINKGYPDVEPKGLVKDLAASMPDFPKIGIEPNHEMFEKSKVNLAPAYQHPDQGNNIKHISGNIKTVLALQFASFEQAMAEHKEPAHLSPLIGSAVDRACALMYNEPPSIPLMQNWLGKMELVAPPDPLHVQTQVEGLLNAITGKFANDLESNGLEPSNFKDTFVDHLKAKLVDPEQGLSWTVLKDTLTQELHSPQYDMPNDQQLKTILNMAVEGEPSLQDLRKAFGIPDAVDLANRLSHNLSWNDNSQDDDFDNVAKLALKNINETIGPIILSEFTQTPLPPQDHNITELADSEPWHMDMMQQLPGLSKGSVVTTDGALFADIPLGSHSMEMMAVQDKEKGGDANYLSVRYVDNTRGTGLTRAHIFVEFFKKCFNVDEISYEQESQGLRFKIPNIDYQNKQNPLYIGRVTQIMKQAFDASADLDFALDAVGRLPEFSQAEESDRVKAFSDVSSGKTKLGGQSQTFIDSLTDMMKTVSEDLLKRKQPHALGIRRMLAQLFDGVPLGE